MKCTITSLLLGSLMALGTQASPVIVLDADRDLNVTSLEARANYKGVGCDNIGLGQTDTDTATAYLKNHCNGHTQSIFSYSGDTVAFYCEWHPGPQCNTNSASNAFSMISDECGLYQAGSYSDGTESTRTYSYGYTNWREHDYCNVPAGTRVNN